MARNVAYTMTFTFKGVDSGASRVAKDIGREMKNMGDATTSASQRAKGGLRELAGAYNSLIVARRAAQAMYSALKPAMEMENAATRLKVATGLSADQVKRLEQAARDAAQVTPFAPAEALEAATKLNLALRNVEGTASALTPTMSLATTFLEGDFNKAATTAARIVGGFRLRAEELAPALDKLAAISRAVGTPVARMDEGFKKLGEASQFMNGSFEDMVTVMALAVRGGTEASRATTGLRTGIMRFGRPEVQSALERMGVTVRDNAGNFTNIKTILLDLARAQDKMAPADFAAAMDKAFGARSVGPWITSINQLRVGLQQAEGPPVKMAEAFRFVGNEVARSKGLLTAATNEAMTPMSQQILLLKQNLFILLETAFAPMVKSLGEIVTGVLKVVQAITGWIKQIPFLLPILTFLMKVLGFVMLLVTAKMAWAGAIKIVTTAMVWLNANTTAFNTGLLGLIRSTYMQATAAYQGARANGVMAASMAAAGVAARTMWSRILGPIGLVIALWGILKAIGGSAQDAADLKVGDIEKAKKDMAATEAKMAAQMKNMTKFNAGLQFNIQELSAAIKDWKNVQKAKLPMPSSQVIKDLNRQVARLGASGKFSETGLKRMNDDLQKVNQVQRDFNMGKFLKKEDVETARQAMWRLTMSMKSTFPLSKKFLKGLDATGQAYENSIRKTKPMAQTMLYYGYRVDELRDIQKRAIQNANLQRNTYKDLLGSEKERAKQLAKSILGEKNFNYYMTKKGGGLRKAVEVAMTHTPVRPHGTEMTTYKTGLDPIQRHPLGRMGALMGSAISEGLTRAGGGVLESISGEKGLAQRAVEKLPAGLRYQKHLAKYGMLEQAPESIKIGFQEAQTKTIREQMQELMQIKGSMSFWQDYQKNITKWNKELNQMLPRYEELKRHGKMAAPTMPGGTPQPGNVPAPEQTNQHLQRLVKAQEEMGKDTGKKQEEMIKALKQSNRYLNRIADRKTGDEPSTTPP